MTALGLAQGLVAQGLVAQGLGLAQGVWDDLTVSDKALLFAVQECDVFRTEEAPSGSNSGQRVDEYLLAARSTPHNRWNAAFVAWCYGQAGWDPFSTDLRSGVMYPASAVSWIGWGKRVGRIKTSKPVRGDLLFFDRPGASHIGFVVHASSTTVQTIEANVELRGSEERHSVVRKRRPIGEATGYISMRPLSGRSISERG